MPTRERKPKSAPTVQRYQRKPQPARPGGRPSLRSPVLDVIGRGGGRPLDDALRRAMEARLGEPLDTVRLHVDARSTESVDAKAYTVGEEIVVHPEFAKLKSPEGQKLLVHELAHVVQQRRGPVDGSPTPGGIRVSNPSDRFERAADATVRASSTGLANAESVGAAASAPHPGAGTTHFHSPDTSAPVAQRVLLRPLATSKYTDYDGWQFVIRGRTGDVIAVMYDPKTMTYTEYGEVVGYRNNMPVIDTYKHQKKDPTWAADVTHLNGMDVVPLTGIGSAKTMHKSLYETLDWIASVDPAFNWQRGQETVDVLYTYSARRGQSKMGGALADVGSCIGGKLGSHGHVTVSQEQLMLGAVKSRRRITVSAHSRGTIKTDNAVRNVYKQLKRERKNYLVEHEKTRQAWGLGAGPLGIEASKWQTQLAAGNLGSKKDAMWHVAKSQGNDWAIQEMNNYIQLIYAGNAVYWPSAVLAPDRFVGGKDFVSILFGQYWHKDEPKFTRFAGRGHPFVENYAEAVGVAIADDIYQLRR